MKQTRIIMGMPVTVEIVRAKTNVDIEAVFAHFRHVDNRYSTYKPASEISRINRGLPQNRWTKEMRQVLELCEETKRATGGYFDIISGNKLDPSGLVKGWAIDNAAKLLVHRGQDNFYVEAGGDIYATGFGASVPGWRVGIRNPFDLNEVVKIVCLRDAAIATSGTYVRGMHIYNPHWHNRPVDSICSLSVIGPNMYDADRFATAAFAMGPSGIAFIERLPGLEGYMIDNAGLATMTSGFERYVV